MSEHWTIERGLVVMGLCVLDVFRWIWASIKRGDVGKMKVIPILMVKSFARGDRGGLVFVLGG